ncbi:MAG TPA: bifunctional phosphoglucose/phosphomannose isomerase [Firmicutes bacterium]|nr:bifunctional phosphoglucose/phosphomannose isomerase [Bacillota bacterium]
MTGKADKANLDNLEWLAERDPSGMLSLVEGLPAQCREAERIARSHPLPDWPRPEHVVVLGMGGSAIGGDLIRALAESEAGVPVLVNRDYSLPRFVGPGSLVIASSYSGNTEETLSAYRQARERGAKIVAICTGGELARLAAADGFPMIRIPGGLMPRAAIGYSFVPLLVLFERLGFLPGQREALAEMYQVLEEQAGQFGRSSPVSANPVSANPVKELAWKLVGCIPLVIGSQGWKGTVAYRWKCQINENAKAPAFWNVFPEMNHNETVGFEAPEELVRRIHVILLRDEEDPPQIARRVDVTKELLSGRVAGITEFYTRGKSAVAKLFSLVYPGDFTSVYLACLHGVDPTPIKAIDRLKAELSKVKG